MECETNTYYTTVQRRKLMPEITPFQSVRPDPALADRIAALPYDVYNRKEACVEVDREPLSFLKMTVQRLSLTIRSIPMRTVFMKKPGRP